MTEHEFKEQVIPCVAAFWPRLVTVSVRPAREHDAADIQRYNQQVAFSREKNSRIWNLVNRYPVDEILIIIRAVGQTHMEFPEYKGPGWVLSTIRDRIHMEYGTPTDQETDRPRRDPSRWTWHDEMNLWHILADMARRNVAGDELQTAREWLGKNPSINERDEGYQIICKHLDQTRQRVVDRGDMNMDEARIQYEYPRERVRRILEGYADWDHRRAEMLAAKQRAAEQASQQVNQTADAELEAMFGEVA